MAAKAGAGAVDEYLARRRQEAHSPAKRARDEGEGPRSEYSVRGESAAGAATV